MASDISMNGRKKIESIQKTFTEKFSIVVKHYRRLEK